MLSNLYPVQSSHFISQTHQPPILLVHQHMRKGSILQPAVHQSIFISTLTRTFCARIYTPHPRTPASTPVTSSLLSAPGISHQLSRSRRRPKGQFMVTKRQNDYSVRRHTFKKSDLSSLSNLTMHLICFLFFKCAFKQRCTVETASFLPFSLLSCCAQSKNAPAKQQKFIEVSLPSKKHLEI